MIMLVLKSINSLFSRGNPIPFLEPDARLKLAGQPADAAETSISMPRLRRMRLFLV